MAANVIYSLVTHQKITIRHLHTSCITHLRCIIMHKRLSLSGRGVASLVSPGVRRALVPVSGDFSCPALERATNGPPSFLIDLLLHLLVHLLNLNVPGYLPLAPSHPLPITVFQIQIQTLNSFPCSMKSWIFPPNMCFKDNGHFKFDHRQRRLFHDGLVSQM